MAQIIIVRHGETQYNKEMLIQGHLDTPLNANGIAQAMVVAKALARTCRFDEIYSSDLQRARHVRDQAHALALMWSRGLILSACVPDSGSNS